jgi:hypothetical protein
MFKLGIKKKYNKEQELNILRLIFCLAGIISPITTYIWIHFNKSNSCSEFMGWFMSVLFITLIFLSYNSINLKKYFFHISFIMFTLSSLSALYFSAVNNFNDEYTLLFFFVIFATTIFLEKRIHLLIFHIFIFTQLLFLIFFYNIDIRRRATILFTYFILIIITYLNSDLIQKKQERINMLEGWNYRRASG